jgi:hypothetical protein
MRILSSTGGLAVRAGIIDTGMRMLPMASVLRDSPCNGYKENDSAPASWWVSIARLAWAPRRWVSASCPPPTATATAAGDKQTRDPIRCEGPAFSYEPTGPGVGLFGLMGIRQPSDLRRMMHDARAR